MQPTALSQSFHGGPSYGESQVPGAGGNLNSVYTGWGKAEPDAGSHGYPVGQFPSGAIPSGAEDQQFRISDSKAFNSLRGIAKTSFPFDPNYAQDHPNQDTTSLADKFSQSDLAGLSSLSPGQFSYNSKAGLMGKSVLDQFTAGSSTFNSLPSAEGPYQTMQQDTARRGRVEGDEFKQYDQGISMGSIPEQYRAAYSSAQENDIPATPFHYVYPNFGVGKPDYGFQEPGADAQSNAIIKAYSAVLPQGQLAGTKKELMAVFSGVNQEAVEQRPVLQSLAKQKNTLYLGGLTELDDTLKIDPRQALNAGSNIPADIVQTAGELASALEGLGQYKTDNGITTNNPFGAPLPKSNTLAPTDTQVPVGFYNHITTGSNEPLIYEGLGQHATFDMTPDDAYTTNQ